MALFLRHLTLLVAVALAAAPARSQPAKEPVRSLRFYYVSFATTGDSDGDVDATFMLRNGKKNVPFQLSANAFSDTFDYIGPTPVALFREKRTESGVERENLGQLQFPAEWKGVLFLVSRDPSNPLLPFRFRPVEYWAPSVPDQQVRILNLCPYPLAAKVGGNQASIGANSTFDLALPAGQPDVPLRLAVQRTDRWERILSTAIARPAQNKLLLLVLPRPDGGARVIIAKDLPVPPPEPTPSAAP